MSGCYQEAYREGQRSHAETELAEGITSCSSFTNLSALSLRVLSTTRSLHEDPYAGVLPYQSSHTRPVYACLCHGPERMATATTATVARKGMVHNESTRLKDRWQPVPRLCM